MNDNFEEMIKPIRTLIEITAKKLVGKSYGALTWEDLKQEAEFHLWKKSRDKEIPVALLFTMAKQYMMDVCKHETQDLSKRRHLVKRTHTDDKAGWDDWITSKMTTHRIKE